MMCLKELVIPEMCSKRLKVMSSKRPTVWQKNHRTYMSFDIMQIDTTITLRFLGVEKRPTHAEKRPRTPKSDLGHRICAHRHT